MFSFQDDDEQWLSLRYDLTAPLARYVAENYEKLPKPYRSYRAGWVFRNEKPGPGRFRQFMQFDADTVGAASPAADAEICMMAADCLEALGVKRGDYVVKVNNRKVLDGVMEAIGLGGAENAGAPADRAARDRQARPARAGRRARAARRGPQGRERRFHQGRGARRTRRSTRRARLSTVAAARRKQARPISHGPRSTDRPFAGIRRDRRLESLIGAANSGSADLTSYEISLATRRATAMDRILIDPSVVRGLEYYTGPVFEAELTFEVKDEAGRPVRFGSVGGGGRYDGLVARFRAEPVPATGFSIGVSRLLAALRAINSPIVAERGRARPRRRARARPRPSWPTTSAWSRRLRGAGIASELYLGAAGLNAQLKYADRRGSLCAIIQGSNERDAPGGPQVVIRDLALGAELAKASKDRADYLEMRQRAQAPSPKPSWSQGSAR